MEVIAQKLLSDGEYRLVKYIESIIDTDLVSKYNTFPEYIEDVFIIAIQKRRRFLFIKYWDTISRKVSKKQYVGLIVQNELRRFNSGKF